MCTKICYQDMSQKLAQPGHTDLKQRQLSARKTTFQVYKKVQKFFLLPKMNNSFEQLLRVESSGQEQTKVSAVNQQLNNHEASSFLALAFATLTNFILSYRYSIPIGPIFNYHYCCCFCSAN